MPDLHPSAIGNTTAPSWRLPPHSRIDDDNVPESHFLYVACQPGTDAVCKQTVLESHEQLRFAFSRPGFLTFKNAAGPLPRGFAPRSAFARIAGQSIGKATGDLATRVAAFWEQAAPALHLHVWARTNRLAREDSDDASPDDETQASAVTEAIESLRSGATERKMHVNVEARPNQTVLDCIVVEPDQWWIGWRETSSPPTRWIGGVPNFPLPDPMISRAYLKMKEALLWSRFPIRIGDTIAEIGSAPGGACQALLETGAKVIGIDPAEMDPVVLANPQFTHIRRRGIEVRRKDLAAARWLAVDSNVAPELTLDTLLALHEHDQVQFDGMLVTLKMAKWQAVSKLDDLLSRIRQMGYEIVKPRHLYHNRRELCIAAARSASVLRKPRR